MTSQLPPFTGNQSNCFSDHTGVLRLNLLLKQRNSSLKKHAMCAKPQHISSVFGWRDHLSRSAQQHSSLFTGGVVNSLCPLCSKKLGQVCLNVL